MNPGRTMHWQDNEIRERLEWEGWGWQRGRLASGRRICYAKLRLNDCMIGPRSWAALCWCVKSKCVGRGRGTRGSPALVKCTLRSPLPPSQTKTAGFAIFDRSTRELSFVHFQLYSTSDWSVKFKMLLGLYSFKFVQSVFSLRYFDYWFFVQALSLYKTDKNKNIKNVKKITFL